MIQKSGPLMRITRKAAQDAVIEAMETRLLLSAGAPDAQFGQDGVAYGELWPGYTVAGTALGSDGKIVAVGNAFLGSGSIISRFNADGSVDRTFGSNGVVKFSLDNALSTGAVQSVLVQPDRKIVILANDDLGAHLFRYLPNGKLDGTFGSQGDMTFSSAAGGGASAMALESNGDIVVGDQSGANGTFLSAFTPSGKLDKSFGNAGIAGDPDVQKGVSAIAVAPGGDIMVAGSYNTAALTRFHANGTLDNSFGVHGTAPIISSSQFPEVNSLAIQSDGKILLGSSYAVLRFLKNGAPDLQFGVKGEADLSPPPADDSFGGPPASYNGFISITVLPEKDGSIIAAGTYAFLSGGYGPPDDSYYFSVARLKSNGSLDRTLGLINTFSSGQSIAAGALLQPDGKIVLVGTNYQYNQDVLLARYLPNGQLDDTFGFDGAVSDANGISGGISAVAVQKDGKIIVAGTEAAPDFSRPAAAALARYNADGTLDLTFGTDGRIFRKLGGGAAGFNAMLIDANCDIVAGGFGTWDGIKLFAVARYLPDGATDHSFGGNGLVFTYFGARTGQQCNALALQPNGDILAVGSTAGGVLFDDPAVAVARFLPDGSRDRHFGIRGKFMYFNPLHRGFIANAVALQKDGKIVIAGSATATIEGTQLAVLRLTAGGVVDTSFADAGVVLSTFGGSFSAAAHALAIDSSGRIVVGGTADFSFALARYLPDGSLDHAFGTGGEIKSGIDSDDEIESLLIQSNGMILIGGTRATYDNSLSAAARVRPFLGTTPPPNLATVARFTSKGIDKSFGVDGLFTSNTDSDVTALTFQTDGKIVAAGNSDIYRLTGI